MYRSQEQYILSSNSAEGLVEAILAGELDGKRPCAFGESEYAAEIPTENVLRAVSIHISRVQNETVGQRLAQWVKDNIEVRNLAWENPGMGEIIKLYDLIVQRSPKEASSRKTLKEQIEELDTEIAKLLSDGDESKNHEEEITALQQRIETLQKQDQEQTQQATEQEKAKVRQRLQQTFQEMKKPVTLKEQIEDLSSRVALYVAQDFDFSEEIKSLEKQIEVLQQQLAEQQRQAAEHSKMVEEKLSPEQREELANLRKLQEADEQWRADERAQQQKESGKNKYGNVPSEIARLKKEAGALQKQGRYSEAEVLSKEASELEQWITTNGTVAPSSTDSRKKYLDLIETIFSKLDNYIAMYPATAHNSTASLMDRRAVPLSFTATFIPVLYAEQKDKKAMADTLARTIPREIQQLVIIPIYEAYKELIAATPSRVDSEFLRELKVTFDLLASNAKQTCENKPSQVAQSSSGKGKPSKDVSAQVSQLVMSQLSQIRDQIEASAIIPQSSDSSSSASSSSVSNGQNQYGPKAITTTTPPLANSSHFSASSDVTTFSASSASSSSVYPEGAKSSYATTSSATTSSFYSAQPSTWTSQHSSSPAVRQSNAPENDPAMSKLVELFAQLEKVAPVSSSASEDENETKTTHREHAAADYMQTFLGLIENMQLPTKDEVEGLFASANKQVAAIFSQFVTQNAAMCFDPAVQAAALKQLNETYTLTLPEEKEKENEKEKARLEEQEKNGEKEREKNDPSEKGEKSEKEKEKKRTHEQELKEKFKPTIDALKAKEQQGKAKEEPKTEGSTATQSGSSPTPLSTSTSLVDVGEEPAGDSYPTFSDDFLQSVGQKGQGSDESSFETVDLEVDLDSGAGQPVAKQHGKQQVEPHAQEKLVIDRQKVETSSSDVDKRESIASMRNEMARLTRESAMLGFVAEKVEVLQQAKKESKGNFEKKSGLQESQKTAMSKLMEVNSSSESDHATNKPQGSAERPTEESGFKLPFEIPTFFTFGLFSRDDKQKEEQQHASPQAQRPAAEQDKDQPSLNLDGGTVRTPTLRPYEPHSDL